MNTHHTLKSTKILSCLAFGALFLTATLISSAAHATLVSPKRVMIEKNRRATAITIVNRSPQTKAYTFSWERRAQSPTGEDILLGEGQTTPGYNPADDFLVYSPRQVIVPPGKSQKVRILAQRSANMEDGEYHSHLLISPTPVQPTTASTSEGQESVGGTLDIRANISIPIFLRQGDTTIDFDVTSAAIVNKNNREFVEINIANRSTRSIYTKQVLECTNAQNETNEITLQNMKLYTEAKSVLHDMLIPKNIPPLSTCVSATLKLIGLDDFEYDKKEIKTIKLR